jgi:hypothetical protein
VGDAAASPPPHPDPRRPQGRRGRLYCSIPFAIAALFAAVCASAHARACRLTAAPSTRWSLTREGGVAWLITPCGKRFYSLGVNALDGGYPWRRHAGKVYYRWSAFAPTLAAWAKETRARLEHWGFNTAGAWSLPPRILKMPTIVDLELGRGARFHWFDPFAPGMQARMTALAKKLVAPYRDSPYRIGYFSDNEVGWWPGALFVFYSMQPARSATKERWLTMLRRYYHGDWRRFTIDFVPPPGIDSWSALRTATRMTRLRPGGHGIAVVEQWCGIVAQRYYTLAAKAIHTADPGALYFGDRLPIYYDPAAVRAMAAHVDAIATNYNPDASDGWIAHYYFTGLEKLSGGKPILVSEWFFAARHNRTGNRNNGHLMTVATQTERARGAAAVVANFARLPEIIGSHWFQYYDDPKGGRPDGEDYDFGLVDSDNRPYRRLVAALSAADRQAPRIHAAAAAPATPAAATAAADPFIVPHAAIALDQALADWPKPASLLPPLVASPGAVAFGEAYLSWSRHGLALATVGQDYYDPDLLAYHGRFPLDEAYRVELGVDLGRGPHRFTLFFIPPKAKRRAYPHLSTLLCRGRAARAIIRGCTAIPGAKAAYFGADQPRITAELVIPWRALGAAPPAPGTALKAAVAITAWYRGRWMSLSGRPPNTAMEDDAGWLPMRLGRRPPHPSISPSPPASGGRG